MTRRIRLIAGALGLAGTLLVFSAAPAAASEETIGSCAIDKAIEAEEHLAEEDVAFHNLHDDALKAEFEALEKEMEKCLEAPSPIIPELDEIIWGGGAFLVLFGFMVWKGVPAVQGAMNDRAEKIAADLDAADAARAESTKIKADHEAALAGAKAEANQIIEEARGQADQLKAELTARANEEVAEMRESAAADAETTRSQALSDLRGDVSEIAIGAAERIIRSNLDRETQSALVDAYIDEVAGD